MNPIQQKIESLLFYRNEPVSFSWLAKQIDCTKDKIKEEINTMLSFYDNRGLTIVFSDDSVSLLTSEISDEIIQNLSKKDEEKELSKQALETLAIILYKGKITKSELDYIRGVNSIFILRNLLIRGLIEKKQNPEDKRSPLYSITHDTFSYLGIHQENELPDYMELKKKLSEIEHEWKDEQITEENLEKITQE